MEYSSSMKKNEKRSFVSIQINLKTILIEVCQTEKVKYHDIAYMQNLKKKIMYMNLFAKQKQTGRVTE